MLLIIYIDHFNTHPWIFQDLQQYTLGTLPYVLIYNYLNKKFQRTNIRWCLHIYQVKMQCSPKSLFYDTFDQMWNKGLLYGSRRRGISGY